MKIKLDVMIPFSLLLLLVAGCETQQVAEPDVIRPEEVRFYTNSPGEFVDKGTVSATSKPHMKVQETQLQTDFEKAKQAFEAWKASNKGAPSNLELLALEREIETIRRDLASI